jgi:hypothetical protein
MYIVPYFQPLAESIAGAQFDDAHPRPELHSPWRGESEAEHCPRLAAGMEAKQRIG